MSAVNIEQAAVPHASAARYGQRLVRDDVQVVADRLRPDSAPRPSWAPHVGGELAATEIGHVHPRHR